MGCIRRILTLLLLGVAVVIAIILLFPRFLAQAGNSLINSTSNNTPSLSGLAQFIPSDFIDKNDKLQISLSGLNARTKYYVTLDPGQCGSPDYKNVGVISTDANGNITATLNLSSLDTSKTWYVDIHNGTDASGTVLSCGQLSTNSSSASADATASTVKLFPNGSSASNGQTPVSGVTPTTPNGFPDTGVAPGSKNNYDNNVYPRKF